MRATALLFTTNAPGDSAHFHGWDGGPGVRTEGD